MTSSKIAPPFNLCRERDPVHDQVARDSEIDLQHFQLDRVIGLERFPANLEIDLGSATAPARFPNVPALDQESATGLERGRLLPNICPRIDPPECDRRDTALRVIDHLVTDLQDIDLPITEIFPTMGVAIGGDIRTTTGGGTTTVTIGGVGQRRAL